MDIVKLAIRNARLTISVLLFLIIAGALAYRAVPKEAEPDVAIPIMYVSLIYQGISPEDSERLLLRPVEAQLKNLKGLKEMRSAAYEGGGYVLVEFDPSSADIALAAAKADLARTVRQVRGLYARADSAQSQIAQWSHGYGSVSCPDARAASKRRRSRR